MPPPPPSTSRAETPYDVVPYPGQLLAQTHPERLATIGKLFGMTPAAVTNCRVLELGCGSAENLIPMAWALPESQFTGVDLAGSAIQQGQELVTHLGLKNCRLIHEDILKIDATWGQFDYIIAHGVYAWVPEAVRNQLLAICHQCLAPQGIAFISYNAYPGAHLSAMLREMMLFHVRDFTTPQERIQQALTLAKLVAGPHPSIANPVQDWLQTETQRLLNNHPGQAYHDELATVHAPVYFTDFIEHARRHELQFVGEADFQDMSDRPFSDEGQQALKQLAGDRIRREQYRDFFKLRRFRQTLLTHATTNVATAPDPTAVDAMLVRLFLPTVASNTDLNAQVTTTFSTQPRGQVQTDLPLGKAALHHLIAEYPQALPLTELLTAARAKLAIAGLALADIESDRRVLSGFMLQLYESGVTRLHTWVADLPRKAGPQPTASPLARWQIARGPRVTTLKHQSVEVEDLIGQLLLGLLDGTRDRAALCEALAAGLEARGVQLNQEQTAAALREELSTGLESNLQALADIGMLIN